MTSSSPVQQLTLARRKYIQARTNLCTALRLVDSLNLPDDDKTGLVVALDDNQDSVHYLSDLLHRLRTSADLPARAARRSATQGDP